LSYLCCKKSKVRPIQDKIEGLSDLEKEHFGPEDEFAYDAKHDTKMVTMISESVIIPNSNVSRISS